MNRNHVKHTLHQISHRGLSRESVIYEAGHATAIYLGNQQKQLPPIFFQIAITHDLHHIGSEWIAKIDGGRLIHTLPTSIEEATRNFSTLQKQAYQLAFEADIVNLLAGPLAEAKYIALCNHEPIAIPPISIQSLQYENAKTSDFQTICEYLECFIADKTERVAKIAELFASAFSFINNPEHWRAIMSLANYIIRTGKDRIDCEEAGFIIAQQVY